MKWARCSTFTESIWIRCSRRSTRRRWRRSVPPAGTGSVKPCAASAMRRACGTESESGTAIGEHASRGVRQKSSRTRTRRCDSIPDMDRIRPLTDADIDALAAVHVRTWQAAYAGIVPAEVLDALDPAEFARIRRTRVAPPGAATIVAETDDGTLAGFANYGPCRRLDGSGYDDTIGEVYAIYVAPERWGTGAGRALLTAARQALTATSEVRIWVLADNHR